MNSENFIITKEYKKFEEFCEACRRYKYIGLCYGQPGVGKTLSAIHYSKWDEIKEIKYDNIFAPIEVQNCKTVFYTAPVVGTALQIGKGIMESAFMLADNVAAAQYTDMRQSGIKTDELYETLRHKEIKEIFRKESLIIIDESDRLKLQSLEYIRSMYDKYNFGLVLIGMPNLEKKLSRYAQLYSRIGFVHEYKTLSQKELVFIMERQLKKVGFEHNPDSFIDQEALSAVAQLSRGNFRLLDRLLQQILRIMQINQTKVITKEIVLGARECLVIGNQ
ncbi:MAG: AAA family ATPase [Rickettsiales bacterium]|nr:AAA family ATPase [Rickettsiales bacterium]